MLPLALGLSAAVLTSPSAYAQATWVGDSSQDWNNAANWSSDPANPTGNFSINTAAAGVFPVLSADSAFTPVDIFVGNSAAAARLDQTAGTLATGNGNWMFVGSANSIGGTFNLADTTSTEGALTVFGPGLGSVNVGGTSTTGGRLVVGNGGASVGTVNVNTSGTLKMEEDAIGLMLGDGGTSVGNLNLDAGIVQINSSSTGIAILAGTNGGDGNFRMSDGTVNATGGIWLGDNNAGSQGLIDVTGGAFNVNATSAIGSTGAGQVFVGRGQGQGTFNVSGTAEVAITGATNIGFTNTATANTSGILTVSGGTFSNSGDLRVGAAQNGNGVIAAGSGTFNVSGGTANIGGLLRFASGNDAGDLVTGASTVSGGVLNVEGNLVLAFAGNNNLGQMTVSGGTVNVATTTERTLVVNQWDTSRGELTVSGGTLNLNANTDLRFSTGNSSGPSIVTLGSGAITSWSGNQTGTTTTGVADLNQGGGSAANNTFNLNGGTLTINQVLTSNNNGTAVFNFNGGTLKAAGNSASFVDLGGASQRANVRDLGAIIDTNGSNVTVVESLLLSDVSGDAGTGGLTKLGAGTLTLAGFNNTYTGTTNVEAGALDLQGSLASPVVVKNGASIAGDGFSTGSLTMNAGSTLVVSTSASLPLEANGVHFTGATTLVFDGIPANGTPYVLFKYGAGGVSNLVPNLSTPGFRTVIDNDEGNQQVTGTVTTASLTWNTTNGTWAVNAGGWTGGFSSYFNGDAVAFNERPAASTVTLSGVLLPAAVTVDNTSNPYTFTGSGSIGGEAVLTKNGTGALTIATANTYTGGTILNAGTLNLNHPSALGTGLLTINGGILDNTSGDAIVMTGNFPQQWNADIAFTGTDSLDMGTGAVAIAGTVETDRDVTVGANTLAVGEIKSPVLGLIKQGPGTLEVASVGANVNASVIAGTLDVAAGTLQINRTGTDGANSGDFTASGIAGSGTIANGAAVERWLMVNTTGSHTFTGTLTNGGTGGLGFNKQGDGSITLSGTLSYTGATTVDGGTLTIPVANSGAGTNPVVNAGTLVMGNPAAFGAAATIRLAGNAVSTLDIATDGGDNAYGFAFGTTTNATVLTNRATPGEGINHTLTTLGADGVGGGILTVASGANVTSGEGRLTFTQLGLNANAVQTTVLNPTTANVTVGAVSKVANATAQTLELGGTSVDNHVTGLIANGTATVSLNKFNSSTWTISGAGNTYSGGTRIGNANGAGVLRATASGALGTGTIFFDGSGGAAPGGPTSRLELSNDITLANAVALHQRNNASAAILNVSGNNTLSGAIDLNTGGNRGNIQSDAGLLTLSGAILTTTASTRNLHLGGAGNGLVSGPISNGTGTLTVTKEGAGTWTLTATNIYTGSTTVAGGTLSLSQASLSDSAAVHVAATAVLDLTHAATDTVDRFFIDGVEQAAGTWGSLTSSATHKTARITGTGILHATNGAVVAGFGSWASSLGLTAGVNDGAAQNPDFDGFENGTEYILGGHPLSGSNNPKIYSLIADSDDGGTDKELIMTIAVPVGTPAFPAGSPSSSVTFEGFGITVRGSTDLTSFLTTVNPVAPVTTGLPAAPVQGGVSYEYRSFSLSGSNGTPGKGFLQVTVTNP